MEKVTEPKVPKPAGPVPLGQKGKNSASNAAAKEDQAEEVSKASHLNRLPGYQDLDMAAATVW